MKVRKKALAVLTCAFVVGLMVFGSLSAAMAAAVPTGTVTTEDTAAPAVPDLGLGSIPIVGDVVNGVVDTVTGVVGSLTGSVPTSTAASPIPGLDSLSGLLPTGGSNPLQPLLDLLNPGNLALPGLGGSSEPSEGEWPAAPWLGIVGDPGIDSPLAMLLQPLHDGLEMAREPLVNGLAPLKEALSPIEEPLTAGLAPVKGIIDDVLITVDPITGPLLDALSPVLCPVLGLLQPVLAYLGEVCPNILPPCPEPTKPEGEEATTPTTPTAPAGGPTTTTTTGGGGAGGVLPFTGANLTAMIVLLMALVGVVIALRRAHLVLKARER